MTRSALHTRPLILALLAAVALAGCLGSPAATGPSPQPSATGPSGPPYPNETAPFPPGPKERPALPEPLTAEAAGDFALTHEFRYSYNELKDGPDTEVGMSEHSCSVDSVAAAADGYRVTVSCTAYVNEPAGGADATRTQHLDLPPWTARYYLDGNSVIRWEVE